MQITLTTNRGFDLVQRWMSSHHLPPDFGRPDFGW